MILTDPATFSNHTPKLSLTEKPFEPANKEKAAKEIEKINKHLQKICPLFFWL